MATTTTTTTSTTPPPATPYRRTSPRVWLHTILAHVAREEFEEAMTLIGNGPGDMPSLQQILQRTTFMNSPRADERRRAFIQWLVVACGATLQSASMHRELLAIIKRPELWTRGLSVPILLNIDSHVRWIPELL